MSDDTYTISVTFLDDGLVMVQAEGDPYPLGIYKETGYVYGVLLGEAMEAIIRHRSIAHDIAHEAPNDR